MKHIFFSLIMCFAFLTGCSKLDDNKIYFFTKTNCPYCQKAEQYISQNYPNLKIEYKNIKSKQNQNLFAKCAKKANIPENQWGTPLICMGDNVFLGWSEKIKTKFDKHVKDFQ